MPGWQTADSLRLRSRQVPRRIRSVGMTILRSVSPLDKHGGPRHSGGPPNKLMWGQPPRLSAERSSARFLLLRYCPANTIHRLRTRHHRSFESVAELSMRITCPGSGGTSPMRRAITSIRSGSRKRGIFQAQRAVHLGQVAEFALRRFDLIAILDGPEMLPGIGEDQQEQDRPARCRIASSRDCVPDLPPSPDANCRSPWRNRFPACRSRTYFAAPPGPHAPNCRCCRHLCRSCENRLCSAVRNLQLEKPLQFHFLGDCVLAGPPFRPLHRRHQILDQCARVHRPAFQLEFLPRNPSLPNRKPLLHRRIFVRLFSEPE